MMCGIAGVFDRSTQPDREAVSRMLEVQQHRGPDGSGLWVADGVILGHRRLSLVDLSSRAAQPMTCPTGRYHVTYNGEIYNFIELREELIRLGHNFSTRGDTEVLLAAYAEWGRDCLHRFNGMFSFALWDAEAKELFVARDRLGVKPLVYAWDGHRFVFASEAKALHAGGFLSGGVNPDAVYEYLARGYTSSGRSFHEGVQVLEPGCALILNADRPLETWAWWKPERSENTDIKSRNEWADHIAALLDDAVRIRLRADVPVGAHLSGGLDSSAVAASAARHYRGMRRLQTYTGAFTDDRGSDERFWARSVARHSGADLREVELNVDQLAEQFERILWHMDEPIAGPGVFPQLMVSDLVASRGTKAVLGGQGGDELFGGYLRHRALHYKRALQGAGSPLQRAGAAFELARMARGEWRRVRRTSTRISDADLAPSFLERVDSALREEVRAGALAHASARDLMWHDLKAYLPALLHVEDRTSMAASIESRTPMLDYRLVELSLQIPERMLFAPRDPKPLLRKAVHSWLPQEVASRRDKKGFPTPLHWWRERPALYELVTDLTSAQSASGASQKYWSAPAEDSELAVFSSDLLTRAGSFEASELWTVLTVNGWLATLQRGAFSSARNFTDSVASLAA